MTRSPRFSALRGLACALLIAALNLTAHTALAASRFVHADGSGDYANIQDAIDAAVSGDEIVLGDGTFLGSRNRNLAFLGKTLTLRSQGGDPALCVLDCERLSRGLGLTQADVGVVVEGITIQNGFASFGGGISVVNTAATFRDCVITGCSADDSFGAAIAAGFYAIHSTVTLEDCAFLGNYFALRGTGAGFFAWEGSNVTATRCRFVGNRAPGVSAGGTGGGIRVQDSRLTLVNCEVVGNMAVIGAGISTGQLCIVDFRNCLVAGNSFDSPEGTSQAAGIQFGYDTDGTVTSCTITGNRASWRGAGISVANDCNLVIERSILWGNCIGAGQGEAAYILSLGEVDFVCSDVDPAKVTGGIVTYTNSLAVDPAFCAPEPCASAPTTAGEYTLDAGSPLIDAAGCGLIGPFGAGCGTVDAPDGSFVAQDLRLRGVPSPFRDATSLRYSIPERGPVEVQLVDAAGRLVARFDEGVREPGTYAITWDGRSQAGSRVPPGVYFARLRTAGRVAEERIVRVE